MEGTGCICEGEYVVDGFLFNASSLFGDEYEVLLHSLLVLLYCVMVRHIQYAVGKDQPPFAMLVTCLQTRLLLKPARNNGFTLLLVVHGHILACLPGRARLISCIAALTHPCLQDYSCFMVHVACSSLRLRFYH